MIARDVQTAANWNCILDQILSLPECALNAMELTSHWVPLFTKRNEKEQLFHIWGQELNIICQNFIYLWHKQDVLKPKKAYNKFLLTISKSVKLFVIYFARKAFNIEEHDFLQYM